MQLPLPKAQLEVHNPVVHCATATPLREQPRPQAPQWATSVLISTQLELQQVVAAPALHGLLQAPQFMVSVTVSTHSELQQARLPGQAWLASQPTVHTPEIDTMTSKASSFRVIGAPRLISVRRARRPGRVRVMMAQAG